MLSSVEGHCVQPSSSLTSPVGLWGAWGPRMTALDHCSAVVLFQVLQVLLLQPESQDSVPGG